MRKISVVLFVSFVSLFLASCTASADTGGCMEKNGRGIYEEGMHMSGGAGHRGMGMMGTGHRMWKQLRGLGLDEKQKEAIKEIRNRVAKDAVRIMADVRIARIELKEMLDKDQVDVNAAAAKLKQIESLKSDLHLSRIKAIEEIKAKLTPEQREEFRKNLKGHGRWMRDGKKATPSGDRRVGPRPEAEHMGH